MILQTDGKIVVAGGCSPYANSSGEQGFCALRYHGNGDLDATFGSAGKITVDVTNMYDTAVASVLQPDGKVLLAGLCDLGSGNTAFCSMRLEGGPFGYKTCSLDIDGDNRVLATTDALIHTRIALGITGSAVTSGITFSPTATRNTWPLIRDFLVTQCGMSLVQ